MNATEVRLSTQIGNFWGSRDNMETGPPQIDPNRIQNESKFETIFKNEKVALQEPLGAVLGQSWSVLEAVLGNQIGAPVLEF